MRSGWPARRPDSGNGAAGWLVVARRLRWGPTIVAILLFSFAVQSLLGNSIYPHNPLQTDSRVVLYSPGGANWFGTDQNGSDVFSRTMLAARSGIVLALGAALSSGILGVCVGLVAGGEGRIGNALMRGLDVLQSFPLLVAAIVLVTLLGGGDASVLYAIWLLTVPQYIRLVRAEVRAMRRQRFVEAARAMGASPARVMFVHILPNLRATLLAQFSLSVSQAILAIAALAYLGVGLQPPTPSWGGMIQNGSQQLLVGAWWQVAFPGLAIVLSVAGFTYLANALGGTGQRRAAPVPLEPELDGTSAPLAEVVPGAMSLPTGT